MSAVLNPIGQPIGTVYNDITPAEASAGVTPTNYQHEPGDPRRLDAPSDGTTDAEAELNSLASVAYKVIRGTDAGAYYVSAGVTFGTGQTIRDIDIVGDPGTTGALSLDSGAAKVLFQNVNVNLADGGAGGGHAVAVSNEPATDLLLAASFFHADRFGILTNVSSGTSVIDGVLNVGNYIRSGIGDAIEYNHPSQAGLHFLSSAVILDVETGSAPGAGWAYGIANVEYSVLCGAVIRQSFVDALHIEDRCKGAVVAAVSGHEIDGDGVTIINNNIGDAVDGVAVVGIHLTHSADANTGHNGLNIVFDTPGSVPGNVVVGTYFKGFEVGYYLGGATTNSDSSHDLQLVEGVARDCDTAVLAGPAFMVGDVLALNCETLAEGSGYSRFDGVYSDEEPATAILTRSDSGGPGVYMRRFAFPIASVSHAGGGAENKVLFELPTRLSGRLVVRWEAGANGIFWSGHIKWDGSTLTVIADTVIEHEPGNTAVANPTESSGDLVIGLTNSTAAVAAAAMLVEFDGVFYVA